MQTRDNPLIAVLIDADNISASHIDVIMEEVSLYGMASIKRIYGDWTKSNMASWKTKVLSFAISPIQQFAYTSKKNATDSALIIDAMDILYSNSIDIFFLISSDSDFTKLAMRLREAGKTVCGIGSKQTPQAFVVSCNRFFYLDALEKAHRHKELEKKTGTDKKNTKNDKKETEEAGKTIKQSQGKKKAASEAQEDDTMLSLEKFKAFTIHAIDDLCDEDGWCNLSELGNYVYNKRSDFDPRHYGHKKLNSLLKSFDDIEMYERVNPENPNVKHIYLRVASKK